MRPSPGWWLALTALVVWAGCTMPALHDWRAARRDSSGQAPDPVTTREPVIQVYAARTVGWRGALAVHSWIVVKSRDASAYTRYQVIGWGVDRGLPAVWVDRMGPDDYWFGSRPQLVADVRGDGVDGLIARVEATIGAYPYPASYRTWPGPNSNTFVAYIARAVPELRVDLPPTAIGKDFLPGGAMLARSPAGRGVQLSLLGVAGVRVGWDEGVEMNFLGLTFGVDLKEPALKVPAVGRLGTP
jgi:Protein of unknown function (DUF3750)